MYMHKKFSCRLDTIIQSLEYPSPRVIPYKWTLLVKRFSISTYDTKKYNHWNLVMNI